MTQQPHRLKSSPQLRFFATAVVALLLFTGCWYTVSGYLAAPAAFVSRVILEENFGRMWVQKTASSPHHLEVQTRLQVKPSAAQLAAIRAQSQASGQTLPHKLVAELTVDIDPARYGYSLPILLALLCAGSRVGLVKNALLGALCLLPFQVFSIVIVILKEAVLTSGASAQTNFDSWQLELVAYGYQLGVLLVPTVIPILLWVWLDRGCVERFVSTMRQATVK